LISEWLGFSKLIPAGATAAKSVYDRIVGKAPRLNFHAYSSGIELHVDNIRDETIIIERIEASPQILDFRGDRDTIDIIREVTGRGLQRPIAVLSSGETAEILVGTTEPFEKSDPDLRIRVRVFWRTVIRGMFSRSSVVVRLTVRDVKDLEVAVERKQPDFVTIGEPINGGGSPPAAVVTAVR